MTITLKPDQQAWLEAQVTAGVYPSVEAAVRDAVDQMMDERGNGLDPAVVKPLLDEARQSILRDGGLSLADFNRHVDTLLRPLEKP